MTILLRMDDKMNRQLTCPVTETDTPLILAQDLVDNAFINEVMYIVYILNKIILIFIQYKCILAE